MSEEARGRGEPFGRRTAPEAWKAQVGRRPAGGSLRLRGPRRAGGVSELDGLPGGTGAGKVRYPYPRFGDEVSCDGSNWERKQSEFLVNLHLIFMETSCSAQHCPSPPAWASDVVIREHLLAIFAACPAVYFPFENSSESSPSAYSFLNSIPFLYKKANSQQQ